MRQDVFLEPFEDVSRWVVPCHDVCKLAVGALAFADAYAPRGLPDDLRKVPGFQAEGGRPKIVLFHFLVPHAHDVCDGVMPRHPAGVLALQFALLLARMCQVILAGDFLRPFLGPVCQLVGPL